MGRPDTNNIEISEKARTWRICTYKIKNIAHSKIADTFTKKQYSDYVVPNLVNSTPNLMVTQI